MTWVDEINDMFEEMTGKKTENRYEKIPCTKIPWYYRGNGVNIEYLQNFCKYHNIYAKGTLKDIVDISTVTQIIGNRKTCKIKMSQLENIRAELCIDIKEVPKLIKNIMSIETSDYYDYAVSYKTYNVKRVPTIAPFKHYYKNRKNSYKPLEVKNTNRDTLDLATFWKRCIEVDIVNVINSNKIEIDEDEMINVYKKIMFKEEK